MKALDSIKIPWDVTLQASLQSYYYKNNVVGTLQKQCQRCLNMICYYTQVYQNISVLDDPFYKDVNFELV